MAERSLMTRIGVGNENEFIKSLREYAEVTKSFGPCDKCGQPVPPWNNVAIFEFINTAGHWLNELNVNRHLIPIVDDNGIVLYEGSPSRNKYLAQGIADTRGKYPYVKEDAPIVSFVHKLMQQVFPH